MCKAGYLILVEYNELCQILLGLKVISQMYVDGLVLYFCMVLVEKVKEILSCLEYLKVDGMVYDIYCDGLNIYIIIDFIMQCLVEEVMKGYMQKL